MYFVGAKYAQNVYAAGALPRTPLDKLTALPQAPYYLAGFKRAYI